MPEDDYTGAQIEDFTGLDGLSDDSFYELELDEYEAVLDDEILFNADDTLNGASSLLEMAARLHDLADELITLSDDGWEIVDDVVDGRATIVQFSASGEPE